MNQVEVRTFRPADAGLRAVVAAGSLMLLFSVLAVVLFATLRSPLKDDIAWLLYVARRWMAGRELYVDVVEVNPPLIVWISAIPLEIARWIGRRTRNSSRCRVSPQSCWAVAGGRPVCCVAKAACSPTGSRCSRRSVRCCWWCRRVIWVSASTCWSRRSCPIWCCSPARWTRIQPRLHRAILAGVVAGLGCALKPRYAARVRRAGVPGADAGAAAMADLADRRRSNDDGLRRAGRARLPGLSAARGAAGAGAVWGRPTCSFLALAARQRDADCRRGCGLRAAVAEPPGFAGAAPAADPGGVRRHQHGDLLRRRQGLVLSPAAGDRRG